MLQYLPRVIYIKFEGVSWRVHPDLDIGVFPLPPSLKSLVDDFSAALPFSLVEPPPEEAPRSWRDPVAPPA